VRDFDALTLPRMQILSQPACHGNCGDRRGQSSNGMRSTQTWVLSALCGFLGVPAYLWQFHSPIGIGKPSQVPALVLRFNRLECRATGVWSQEFFSRRRVVTARRRATPGLARGVSSPSSDSCWKLQINQTFERSRRRFAGSLGRSTIVAWPLEANPSEPKIPR
jgi:hypothetical protein